MKVYSQGCKYMNEVISCQYNSERRDLIFGYFVGLVITHSKLWGTGPNPGGRYFPVALLHIAYIIDKIRIVGLLTSFGSRPVF